MSLLEALSRFVDQLKLRFVKALDTSYSLVAAPPKFFLEIQLHITAVRRGRLYWPRPLAGTNSTVKALRPPTTISVPSGSCWLVAYHLPSCRGVFVSTQLQLPDEEHGENVRICICIQFAAAIKMSINHSSPAPSFSQLNSEAKN
jgi:hypothetical protein